MRIFSDIKSVTFKNTEISDTIREKLEIQDILKLTSSRRKVLEVMGPEHLDKWMKMQQSNPTISKTNKTLARNMIINITRGRLKTEK